MAATSFHDMTEEELKKQLDASRRELLDHRFNFAVARSLQNPARVSLLKRNIARILTVQTARRKGIDIRPKTAAAVPAKGKKKK